MSDSRREWERGRSEKDVAWAGVVGSALQRVVEASARAGVPRCRVVGMNESGNRFEVELRFAAGEEYCCCEPCCYMATSSRAWWERLRAELRESSDRELVSMAIVVHLVVEEGAVLKESGGAAMRGFNSRCEAEAERDAR